MEDARIQYIRASVEQQMDDIRQQYRGTQQFGGRKKRKSVKCAKRSPADCTVPCHMRNRSGYDYCTNEFPTYSIPLPGVGETYGTVPVIPNHELNTKLQAYDKRYIKKTGMLPTSTLRLKAERRIRSSYNRSAKGLVVHGIYQKTASGLTAGNLMKSGSSGKYTTKQKAAQRRNIWLQACAIAKSRLGLTGFQAPTIGTELHSLATIIKNRMKVGQLTQ